MYGAGFGFIVKRNKSFVGQILNGNFNPQSYHLLKTKPLTIKGQSKAQFKSNFNEIQQKRNFFNTTKFTQQSFTSKIKELFGKGGNDYQNDQYRKGYPNRKERECHTWNIEFYNNKLRSLPEPGGLVDEIHRQWFGKHEFLDSHNGFIQWLFPFRESPGSNRFANELLISEISQFREDENLMKRYLKSIDLIFDYFGLKLTFTQQPQSNEQTENEQRQQQQQQQQPNLIIIERNPRTWKERYHQLNTTPKLHKRVSRVLKSVGEMGFEDLKVALVQHFVKEISENKELDRLRAVALAYWVPTILDEQTRNDLSAQLEEKSK